MTGGYAQNPFQATQTFAWDDPIDVPSLNRDVSDLILHGIDQVRAASRGEALVRSSSTLVLGPAGSGKTHLFTRLRRREGARAVFVHRRPEIGADPALRNVLGAIVDALRQPVVGDDHQQIDVIVGAMLSALSGWPRHQTLMRLDDCRRLPAEERQALLESAVESAGARYPEIRPEYLERLLAVPFASRQGRRALLAWLGGREPNELDLARARAHGALVDHDVMPALCTLGVAASFGAPIVLVFDQLENLDDGTGPRRITAHARVLTELRDTVRGLVLVQMALDSKWREDIHPALTQSDRDRLEETVKLLAMPTPAERRELLVRWIEALPEDERRGPFPSPFGAEEVERWTRSGMTPRMLMQTCGEAYARASATSGRDEPIAGLAPATLAPPEDQLELHWANAREKARLEIDDASEQSRGVDAERIAGGLITALRLLGRGAAPAARKNAVALRLEGSQGDEIIIAQHTNARSLAAVIRAATETARERPSLLMREHALAIPPTWREVDELLREFDQAGRRAAIGREDLARLLALHDLLGAARSQDLSGADGRPIAHADAEAWARTQLDCADWDIVEAVLGRAPRVTAAPEPLPAEPPRSPARSVAEPPRAAARPSSSSSSSSSPAFTVLERLRVASIDRLVREARTLDPSATRATVMAELAELPVRVFGDSIVALQETR